MKKSGLVYSTDRGRTSPGCGDPPGARTCARKSPAPSNGRVRIRRSTSGRKGKAVIVITGIPLPPDQLKTLAKELKRKCGSGGTVKDGTMEIQGEHLPLLKSELEKRGYRVAGQ